MTIEELEQRTAAGTLEIPPLPELLEISRAFYDSVVVVDGPTPEEAMAATQAEAEALNE